MQKYPCFSQKSARRPRCSDGSWSTGPGVTPSHLPETKWEGLSYSHLGILIQKLRKHAPVSFRVVALIANGAPRRRNHQAGPLREITPQSRLAWQTSSSAQSVLQPRAPLTDFSPEELHRRFTDRILSPRPHRSGTCWEKVFISICSSRASLSRQIDSKYLV